MSEHSATVGKKNYILTGKKLWHARFREGQQSATTVLG